MQTPEQTIELVKKWLDKPESVSKEELRKTADAAADTANAADTAANDAVDAAKHWVKQYEKLAQKEG